MCLGAQEEGLRRKTREAGTLAPSEGDRRNNYD